MQAVFDAAAEHWFWTVVGMMVVIWTICATAESILKSMGRERSRREIAAYVAEGSMTPEQGERLLRASGKEADE
jgi:hypothetical protein